MKQVNFRKLLIFVIVLWFWYITFMTMTIARAYPSAKERCLAPFQPVTLISISGGSEFYEAFDKTHLEYRDGDEFIRVGIHSIPQNCEGNPKWYPSAVALYVPMTSDCAYFEVDNLDGGWSVVNDLDGNPIILHYGEPLVVGAYDITDVNRYRAVAIPCF